MLQNHHVLIAECKEGFVAIESNAKKAFQERLKLSEANLTLNIPAIIVYDDNDKPEQVEKYVKLTFRDFLASLRE